MQDFGYDAFRAKDWNKIFLAQIIRIRQRDFLTLWKDVDPDIPIFIAAKAEYSKLQ
jgi:hypothetical protein